MSLTKATYSMITGAPANVLDYGAVGNGVTNDAPAFQAAIDSGAKYIVIPEPKTSYLLNTSLNMTGLRGVTFDFQASLDINVPKIIAAHTGAVFDLTASFDCCFINPNVKGDATTTPTCMFLLARNSTGASAGRHRLFNPRSAGKFSASVLYNYGSEEVDVYSPMFINEQTGKSCVYITAYNTSNLTSSFATIATGAQSTVCHNYYGGSYYSQGNSGLANEACIFLDSVGDMTIDGAFMYCPYGISQIYISGANAASANISITNIRFEIGASNPTHNIYYGTGTGITHINFNITGCRFAVSGTNYSVYGADPVNFDSLNYQNNIATNGYGISVYSAINSNLNHGVSRAITRYSGSSNVWTGAAVNRTPVGQDGIFIDTVGRTITSVTNYSYTGMVTTTPDGTKKYLISVNNAGTIISTLVP